MSNEAKSPCIGVCLLDEDNVCVGCERHIQQIIDWPDINIPPVNLNNSLSADNFYPDHTYNEGDDNEEHW